MNLKNNYETGAMLFESDRQWTFAYMFYLKDSKARGASRWYSFLVLTKNFPYLVRSTVTLTQYVIVFFYVFVCV